jgi:putative radical SAM enzyme (TIGR03279 family)
MDKRTSRKGIPISSVAKNSIAADLGIAEGDLLLAIDDKEPCDLIDYSYLVAGEIINLHIRKKSGAEYIFEIEKEYDEDLGLEFNSKVFTTLKECRNHCLFCFVDQMPRGLRRSLYIKDDDYRLSFLDGSFITMTNLGSEEVTRIIEQRLSPLYISVHTTDPYLRCKLMGNKGAEAIKDQLQRLAETEIEFHAQVVLIPGVNDGFYLEETISDLVKYWPYARSLALVPVGLTRHRRGLYPLQGYNREQARRVIGWAQGWQKKLRKELGSTFLYLADEFYVLTGEPLPEREHYDDFPQLENGVGLLRLFYDDLSRLSLPGSLKEPLAITLATGVSAAGAINKLADRLRQIKNLAVQVEVVPNNFFGPSVTVAGLITGSDLLQHFQDRNLGNILFLPEAILRRGADVFLDGMSIDELGSKLGVDVAIVSRPTDVVKLLVKGGEEHWKNRW